MLLGTGMTLTCAPDGYNFIYYSDALNSLTASLSAPGTNDILLAEVVTDGSSIRFIHTLYNEINGSDKIIYDYLLEVQRFRLGSGLMVFQGTNVNQFSISVGHYYISSTPIPFPETDNATFSYFYGNNGATEVPGQTTLDITNYDNGGTLTAMSDGYYKADTVYITSDGRVEVIYGNAEYQMLDGAIGAMPASAFPAIYPSGFLLATLIIQDGYGIVSIQDKRQTDAGGGGTSGNTVLFHHDLLGLLADDHPQYLLINGTRAMGGNLDMGANNIIDVGTVDGVVVHLHGYRHNPGGPDPLGIGTPVNVLVGATPAIGSAASYAVSDHQHGIAAGTPVTIGTTNAPGTASSTVRSDHVHAHGDQTDPTLHALATETTAGFMSPTDKFTVDNAVVTPDGYTNSHETLRHLIHFLEQGPGHGFNASVYKEVLPAGNIFPTSITWYIDNTKTQKIIEKLITWQIPVPTNITYNMYNPDGVTIAQSCTDTITYVNTIFETSRTRVFT